MRVYSHRGNTNGTSSLENEPSQVLEVAKDFFVEVDVWKIGERYLLGHDKPQYQVDKFFLFNEKFLLHCKNPEAFFSLSRYHVLDAFFQTDDLIALSTQGHLVTHSLISKEEFSVSSNRIVVDPGMKKTTSWHQECFGLVTDFPGQISAARTTNNWNFDLLILDIDGVLTSGQKTYGLNGTPISKAFLDRDFTAIKRFANAGVNVVFLSGDRNVNELMAKHRGIEFVYARLEDGNIDKEVFLQSLVEKHKATKTCYVGDDYYDLTLLSCADLSVCPADSAEIVKEACDLVTKCRGGEGVVAELFEVWKRKTGSLESFAYDRH